MENAATATNVTTLRERADRSPTARSTPGPCRRSTPWESRIPFTWLTARPPSGERLRSSRTTSLQSMSLMSLADRRISIWLALLTFATYAYFFAGGGWNQNAQFDLTRAIVERHTFAIDAYAGNTGDVSFANGHIYANKAPALAWLAAIPYAALHAAGS